jgi:SAM-dependent methyltransferase
MATFSPVIRSHLQQVSHHAHGRLLDVGCGNKPYRDVFSHVSEYIGMDRPAPEVDGQRPDAAGRRAHYDVEGCADRIPFPDGRFESILCTQVIEHMPDPRRFFAEAARVAAPGAVLILTAPLINPVHEAPYDFYRYTNYGLTELCLEAGWRVDQVMPLGGTWLSVGYLLLHAMSQRALRARGPVGRRVWQVLGERSYGFFLRVDRRYPQPDAPVGYLLLARKPS